MDIRTTAIVFACAAALTFAGTPYDQARALYARTDYAGALQILSPAGTNDAPTWKLAGQCYFLLASYKEATDAFEHAIAIEPNNSELAHWLGKSWGRRAEAASPLTAPIYAARARQQFERAVLLDGANKEALNDLFDYYLQAPGFLGGGLNRAEALIAKIEKLDAAEGHYARAQLLDKKKEFDAAEQQLRRAFELAPRQLGRFIDLASYLSKRGRVQESEAFFARAESIAPNNPRLLYARAQTYIRDHRNADAARELLKKYLRSRLTPEDPPRESAEALLRTVSGA